MQFKGLIKPAELSPFHSLKWMKYASLQGVSILDCKLPLFRVSKDFISYSLTGWQKRIANWSFSVTGCLEIANFDCKLTFFLTGWSMILSKVGQLWLQTRHFWELSQRQMNEFFHWKSNCFEKCNLTIACKQMHLIAFSVFNPLCSN